MTDFVKIHAGIWSPFDRHLFKPKASEPAECTVWECQIPTECSFLKLKQCINHNIFGPRCVYGKKTCEVGPTKRSRKCSEWVNNKREEYKDIRGKISAAPPVKIAKVGEYIYLPYAHMDMNVAVPFRAHSDIFISGIPFIAVEKFTLEVIKSIVSYHPRALMGGEITSYQSEVVPKFVKDLSEVFPNLYAELIRDCPEFTIKNTSAVGRKALLTTLLPGNVNISNIIWKWDGSSLSTNDEKKVLFLNIDDRNGIKSFKTLTITVVPTDETVVQVYSDDQVTDKTVFVD